MDDQFLFEMPAVDPAARAEEPRQGGQPRLRCAVRDQIEFRACALNDMLPDDHQARIVWKFVEGLDLSPIYDQIASVAGRPGHPAADPRILFTLWLYATLRGVGSARELDRLCEQHVAYMWICGGVSMNYHTLSDFRTRQVEVLDQLRAGLYQTRMVCLRRRQTYRRAAHRRLEDPCGHGRGGVDCRYDRLSGQRNLSASECGPLGH